MPVSNHPLIIERAGFSFHSLSHLTGAMLRCAASCVVLEHNGHFSMEGAFNFEGRLTNEVEHLLHQALRDQSPRIAAPCQALSLSGGTPVRWMAAIPIQFDSEVNAVLCVFDAEERSDLGTADFERVLQTAYRFCQTGGMRTPRDSGPHHEDLKLQVLDKVRIAQSMFIDGRPTEEVFSFLVNALTTVTQSTRGFLGEVTPKDRPHRTKTLGITAIGAERSDDLFASRATGLAQAIERSLDEDRPVWSESVVWHDPENAESQGHRVRRLLVLPARYQDRLVGVVAIGGSRITLGPEAVEQLSAFLQSFASLVEGARARNQGRQLSEALRLRDRSLASISSAVAIADLGRPNKPFIYCNQAFEVMTGYPAEEVVGKDFRLFEGPETDSQTKALIRSAFDEGQECEMTVRTYRRDGSWFWNHLRFSPVVESSGAIRHLVAIADDITETVQNQRRISESEARKSAILRSSLDCVLTVDITGLILDCNPAAALALGYDCGDRINQELKDLIIPSNSDRLRASEVTVGERREISVTRRDGTAFPADLVVTAMLEQGQPIYTAHLRDLTTWKKALKQQRETVAFQRAILDGANHMIIATDLEGTVRTFNNAASRMLGFSREEVVGRLNLSSFHDPIELRRRSRRRSEKTGEPPRRGLDAYVTAVEDGDLNECTYVRKDGTRFPVQISISMLQNDVGETTGFLAIGNDITERRIAQKEQQKFVALVENSDDFIGMSTLDGRAFYVNEAGLRLAGLESTDQVRNTRIPNFVTKDTWKVVRDIAMPALRKTGKWEGEGQLRHFQTGKPVDVLITLFVVRDGKTGEPLCLATVQRDITDQKRAERALIQEKELSETLIRSSVDGILAFDRGFLITAWNPAMEHFAGLIRKDVIGRDVFAVFPFLINDPRFTGVLNGVSGIMEDSPYVVPETGRRGYFEAYCSPLRDASAEIIGGLAVVRDTTERRRAEESVRLNEKRYRTVVENIREVIFYLRTNGTWAFLNPAWTEITGFEITETSGANWIESIDPEHRPMAAAYLDRMLSGEAESVRYEMRILTRTGEPKWVEAFARATTDESGGITGISGTLTDVSERRKTAEEMIRAKETAEAAARLKSEFLANMSHEIRTPINAVIGMTSILSESTLSDEQRDYVNVIRQGGESLLSIIDGILDFSKIESGRMELERAPFDLRESIEQSLDLVAARASEKSLELAYLVDPGVPAVVAGDSTKLKQILVNLLSNAVKFTLQGYVLVTVTSTPRSATVHRLQFSVKDSGIGIPADKLEHIFKSFSQVDASTTRRYGGTGLGLTISKHLCEMSGGEIWVESTEGTGSTFHFTILADTVESKPPSGMATANRIFEGGRAVIIQADTANALVLQHHLAAWKLQAQTFSGLPEFQSWIDAGNSYDLAIVDSDGAQVSAEVCDDLCSRGTLVLLHSVGRRRQIPSATLLKADPARLHFLGKPIKPSLLYDLLLKTFEGEGDDCRPNDSFTPGDILAEKIPARILLAEDNVVNQKVARLLLAKLGYQVHVANTGREAIEALRLRHYDVVLMDMQMPELDGVAATRCIRVEFNDQNQPYIIAMTANAMQEDRERCFRAGMQDFLSKPVQLRDLKGALERFGAHMSVTHSVRPADSAIWELPDYLKEIGDAGDCAVVRELLDLFREESRGQLELLRIAIVAGDRQTAHRLAHGLKGSAAQIGAVALSEQLAALESHFGLAHNDASVDPHEMFSAVNRQYCQVEERLLASGLAG